MTRRTARRIASAAIVAAIGLATTGCSGDEGEATIAAGSATTVGSLPSTTNSPDTSTSTQPAAAPDTTDDPGNPGPGEPPARLDTVFDSAAFADRLSSSHATMVDTAATAGERERAGIDHQLVLRELADRPELDEEVLAALDPAARPAVERVVRARQFLQQRSESRPPQPVPDELPAWTIVEPEPVETLLAHYAEAEQLTGVAWYWLAAIHLQETRMGRIQGVSSADAVGPMQFLPETWARCCNGDPTVTRDAIIGAATYLAQSGAPDDMAAALYEYNPNDGYVAVVTAYAESLRDEPELYPGYHAFQVFFGSSAGTVRLPVGYAHATPIAAAEYLESNPQDAA